MLYILVVVATFCVMEGVTWLTHRYVMHGLLWMLHEDHHQKKPGLFEKNDSFFVIFAAPSVTMIFLGTRYNVWWMQAIGFGIMAYGAAYFLVHDVIIHQRFKWFRRSKNRYIKAIRRAHKMHHKHLLKNPGESFGMLIVHKKYWRKTTPNRKTTKQSARTNERVP